MEAKFDAKKLALEEGLQEDDLELFFRGEKEEWESFVRQLWLRTGMRESQFVMKQSYC